MSDKVQALFEQHDDEFLKFDRIPAYARMHERKDLCAFLYLHSKLGGKGDILGASEHDNVWLDFEGLDTLTSEDVLYICRCGVQYDGETESLCMYV